MLCPLHDNLCPPSLRSLAGWQLPGHEQKSLKTKHQENSTSHWPLLLLLPPRLPPSLCARAKVLNDIYVALSSPQTALVLSQSQHGGSLADAGKECIFYVPGAASSIQRLLHIHYPILIAIWGSPYSTCTSLNKPRVLGTWILSWKV